MTIAVIIIACLIGHPEQCETIPTGMSVGNEQACEMAGQMWAAGRLKRDWILSGVKCEAGFIDEHQG